jgi:hypothetical protein
MIAEMKAPKSTSVLGLPDRISTPSPFLPGSKLWTSGLMRSVVKAVIRALNARATTRPTATTITSPRIRKFLNPLMSCSPIRWDLSGWVVTSDHRRRAALGFPSALVCLPVH